MAFPKLPRLLGRSSFSLTLPLLTTVLLLAIWFMIPYPDDAYSLDPALQLQRFGLVSEDGTIEADKIESVRTSTPAENKDHLYKYFGNDKNDNNNNAQSNSNSNSNSNSKRRMRNSKLRNGGSSQGLVQLGADGNAGVDITRQDQATPDEIKAYRERMKNSKNSKLAPVNNNLLADDKVMNFIANGEPEEELSNLSNRARKLFLRKVAAMKESSKQ